jgi:hypothetical protein
MFQGVEQESAEPAAGEIGEAEATPSLVLAMPATYVQAGQLHAQCRNEGNLPWSDHNVSEQIAAPFGRELFPCNFFWFFGQNKVAARKPPQRRQLQGRAQNESRIGQRRRFPRRGASSRPHTIQPTTERIMEMKHSTLTGRIAVLAFCLFVVPALASPKNPVERPFKIVLDETIVLDLSDFTWTAQVSGQATHLGRFTGSGFGTCDFFGSGLILGEMTLIAANGDELWLELEALGTEGPAHITIVGGTGRFEHATGFYDKVEGGAELVDVGKTTLTFAAACKGAGRITY